MTLVFECPMCGGKHPPGLLNCVVGEGVGLGAVMTSEPVNELFDFDIWVEARGAMLEEASRKIRALLAPPAPPPEVTEALEKLRTLRAAIDTLLLEQRDFIARSAIDMTDGVIEHDEEAPFTITTLEEIRRDAIYTLDALRAYHRLSLNGLEELLELIGEDE